MSFNYLETGASTAPKRGAKRGFASVSKQMMAQRNMYTDAEEDSLGQPSICQQVYTLLRCPGPPCHIGPYCWQDPVSKKRYRLKTHHFKALIEYVEQGGMMQSQDDIPESLRQLLFAEEQHSLDHQQRKAASTPSCPPINITNVMPTPSPEAPSIASTAPTPTTQPICDPLEILGPRDVAVKEYCEWQSSQVVHAAIKQEFAKAYHVIMEHYLDLEQVFEDRDPEFFINNGIKIGVARRLVRDIGKWVKQRCGD